MNTIEVRPASSGDAAAIAGVHIDSFVATYAHLPITRRSSENGLAGRVRVWARRLQSESHTILVATDAGRVCGFVHLGPSPDHDATETTGQVLSIHVTPELSGRGVGKRLMGEAVAALVAAGFRTATLWVVSDNRVARRFYERLGWREDGTRRRERLAVGDESGDEVEVVRYRLDLPATRQDSP